MILKTLKILPFMVSTAVQPVLDTPKRANETPITTENGYVQTPIISEYNNANDQNIHGEYYYGIKTNQTMKIEARIYSEVYSGYNGRVAFFDVSNTSKCPQMMVGLKITNITGVNKIYIRDQVKILDENYSGYTYQMYVDKQLYITQSNAENIWDHDREEMSVNEAWQELAGSYTTTLLKREHNQFETENDDGNFVYQLELGNLNDKYNIVNSTTYYLFFYYQAFSLNNNTIFYTNEPTIEDYGVYLKQQNVGSAVASIYYENDIIATNVIQEVIDIPDIMFTVLTMPFSFISQAFNLTLFPNTPYAINISNLLLALIAVLIFAFVMKIILGKLR